MPSLAMLPWVQQPPIYSHCLGAARTGVGVYLCEEKDECRRSLTGPREAALVELKEVDTVLVDEPGLGWLWQSKNWLWEAWGKGLGLSSSQWGSCHKAVEGRCWLAWLWPL